MYSIAGVPITCWIPDDGYLKEKGIDRFYEPILKEVKKEGGQSVTIIPFDFSINIGFTTTAVVSYIEEICRLIDTNIDMIAIAFPCVDTNKKEKYINELFDLLDEKTTYKDMYGFIFDSSVQIPGSAVAYLKNSTLN